MRKDRDELIVLSVQFDGREFPAVHEDVFEVLAVLITRRPTLGERGRDPRVGGRGFRALASVEDGRRRLISRRQNEYRTFAPLCQALARELSARSAVLEGEIVCLDPEGKPRFYDLLRRRGTPRFYAFDVLSLDGRDLRELPLIERKQILRGLIPTGTQWILYSGHIEERGVAFFGQVCRHDLEGIVAKVRNSRYVCGPTASAQWAKIKRPLYSQLAGRRELFDRFNGRGPDTSVAP